MSFRTTNYNYNKTYLGDLHTTYGQYAKLLEQADGSKLHRASDSSTGYSKYLRYRNTMTSNLQYQSNTTTARSWMNNSDSVLVNVTSSLSTFTKKVIESANSTNNSSDMKDIAKELKANVEEIVLDMNTQIGDRYLFSGQSDNILPFKFSEDKVDRGLTKTLDAGETAYFGTSAGDTGTITQFLTMKGDDGNKYYLNTANGDVYTQEFVDSGYKTQVSRGINNAQTTDKVGNVGGAVDVTQFFDSYGVINTAGRSQNYSVSDGKGGTVNLSFATVNQYIVEYNGDDKYISMVTEDGLTQPVSDTVNVTGQDVFGSDIFDYKDPSGTAMLNNLLAAVAQIDNGESHWAASDATTIANAAYDKVLAAETRLAARNQAYRAVDAVLDTQEEKLTSSISEVSSADISKLATELTNFSKTYSLSLTLGARILPLSLAQYL